MFGARFDPPRSHLTRRHLLGGAGTMLLATACGRTREPAPSPGSSRGFPVTIRHKYGSTEIPAEPRRVVTVGLTEQDYVLALGIAPVAAREWFGDQPGALWPWAGEALGRRPVPTSLPRARLNFERIAALAPDLVIGMNSGLTGQEYDTLSRLAPTLAQPGEYSDYGVPWQELTRTIGRATGRERRAEGLVRDIERRFERARTEHPEFQDATGLLATSIRGSVYAYAAGPAPRFLKSLGFGLPPAAAELFPDEDDRDPVQLSPERLKALEADALLLGRYGSEAASITRNPLYQRLDVAREGRDIVLPKMSRINGALSFGSVLSLPIALDELVPRLAKAVDGDPATEPAPVT